MCCNNFVFCILCNRLEQVKQSQTAEFLAAKIEVVVEELTNEGMTVIGVVADGALNCQNAIRDTAKKMPLCTS